MEDNTLFVGKVLIELEETGSTNSYALQMCEYSRPIEGTAITAEFQSEGKGQYGNVWKATKGKNLLASVILYPSFLPAGKQFLFNKAVSLAVKDTIKGFVEKEIKVKWPNDIFIGGKKVAGILIENILKKGYIDTAIAGIGINVNQEEFPADVCNATSLFLETGIKKETGNVRQKLFEQLEKRYLQLKSNKIEVLNTEYLQSLYKYQEQHIYYSAGETFKGQILGVSPEGRLLIEHKGSIRSFDFKEVKYVN